jgi:hypothetical protein
VACNGNDVTVKFFQAGNENELTVTIFKLVGNGNDLTLLPAVTMPTSEPKAGPSKCFGRITLKLVTSQSGALILYGALFTCSRFGTIFL